MNNSNNNIFGDSNNTSLPQNGNSTGTSLSPQPSHLVNSANSSTVNTNYGVETNSAVNPSQINQSTSSMQSQTKSSRPCITSSIFSGVNLIFKTSTLSSGFISSSLSAKTCALD